MTDDNDFVIEISARPETNTNKSADAELDVMGAEIKDGDFSLRKLTHITVTDGSVLTRCTFQGSLITAGGLGDGGAPSIYKNCNFDGCKIERTIPGHARFVACSFNGATIQNMQFLDAEFIDCVFDDALIRDVVFDADKWDADPSETPAYRYHNNDFSSARLRNVSFRGGIDLDSQKLPQGEGYLLIRNAGRALTAATREIQTWESESCRTSADISLGVLQRNAARKQKNLFIEKEFIAQGLTPECTYRLIQALVDA
ncbi:pentapeptide repeat-containing protein [Nonomuraea aridisoli]|uniref:pentapeptide repeat-containing protein n=1 Tax=Nonomuraea aridisoli TaxID=2070368 RepID=UPI000DA717C3|nr:pentapeptide repeat-containing protein [Nonomuraea aridisoli]